MTPAADHGDAYARLMSARIGLHLPGMVWPHTFQP